MDRLMREFQIFWQENSETWEGVMPYTEAFPHLLLQAFMQRVSNGEGRIEREYAAGRKRMDLAVEYHGSWNIVEIKLVRDGKSYERVASEGKDQVAKYRDLFGGRNGGGEIGRCYLVIFDRRSKAGTWAERLTWEEAGDITVVGC
jgi:hypothetical protein